MKYHISMRRCASVANLETIKDVTREDAEKIRKVWRTVTNRADARAQIDAIIRTHGVEYLGQNRRNGEHVYYCNAGDTYAATIIFQGLRLSVGCWGDIVERGNIRESREY